MSKSKFEMEFMKLNPLYYCLLVLILVLSACSSGQRSANDPKFNSLLKKEKEESNYIDTSRINRLAREYVLKGSAYQQQYRYAEAILEFQEALKYDSSASIFYAIAKNYKELNKYNRAVEYLVKSIDRDKTFIPAIELLAEVYMLQYRLDDAITTYEQIVEMQPSKNNQLILARLYEFKYPQKAITLLENVLKDGGDDFNVLSRLSELYEQTKNTAKYLNTLEKLYAITPDDARTALSLLEARLNSKDYPGAFELMKKISKSVPSSDLDVYYGFLGNKLIEDSSDAAKKYIPDYLGSIDNRFYYDWRINLISGYLADRLNDSLAVGKYFDHALKVSDTIPDVPLQVGFFYLSKNRNNEALKVFRDFGPRFATDARFPLYEGIVYTNLDSNNQALSALTRSAELDGSNVDTWAQIGIVYDRLGQSDSSDRAYETALKIDPKNPLVNNNFAYSLSERGINLDRALAMSGLAVSAEPNNPSYLDTYGWVEYKLGHYDSALKYVQRAIDNQGSSAEVYEHLGDIYQELKKPDEAKKAWQKGLDIEPGNRILMKRLNLIE